MLATTWLAWPEPPAPPPTPTTVAVTRGDIESTVAASGALEAASRVDVGAQVSGQLKALHVKLGDVVAEGDLLAEIDDFIQKTRVAS
ncbi:MAG: biotin/lipoyl-binding protein, partial [Gammaproteobacteria bacterium]|nr:biotin/lipoyl-binding protein [Gammaproteobacteria bacterium]